jgi:hypothetical protein
MFGVDDEAETLIFVAAIAGECDSCDCLKCSELSECCDECECGNCVEEGKEEV